MHRHPLPGLVAFVVAVLVAPVVAGGPSAWAKGPSTPMRSDAGIRPAFGIHGVLGRHRSEGVMVEYVIPGSVAAKVGLRPGDVLLTLAGKPIHSLEDIRTVFNGLRTGQKLDATFSRKGKTLASTIALPKAPRLASYELVEGRGIRGVVMIGDAYEEIVSRIGRPGRIEDQGERGVRVSYELLGLTLNLRKGDRKCFMIMTMYPFVGQSARGLKTDGTQADALRVYGSPPRQAKDGRYRQLIYLKEGFMVTVDERGGIQAVTLAKPAP